MKIRITKFKKTKAYTLIEVLAAAAIFSGMMIIAVSTFAIAASNEAVFSTKKLVNQSTYTVVDSMLREAEMSRNQYDLDGNLTRSGFYIFTQDSQGSSSARLEPYDQSTGIVKSQFDPTDPNNIILNNEPVGNGLVVFYQDKLSNRLAKAYYLCPHPDVPALFSFGVQELDVTDINPAHDEHDLRDNYSWIRVRNQLDCDPVLWQPLISDDVALASDGSINPSSIRITGYYPENNLPTQPRLTISVTVRTRDISDRPGETASVTYRSSMVHRDYGNQTLP